MELTRLVTVRALGRDLARLDDLWTAAHMGVKPVGLRFDFVGDDGFRLRSKLDAGIAGAELWTGYVCVATRDLVWAPSPSRPRYCNVEAVGRILATAA